MNRRNALYNCKNPYQGPEKKVLAVCSAGLLRSPTVAWFLGQHNYNTRSCGIHDYALIQMDEVLLTWADIIIFVHHNLKENINTTNINNIIVFDIPDRFSYKQPELLDLIKQECIKHGLINE